MQFSPLAADHISAPRNAGRLQSATHVGAGGIPGDGPYVQLWLEIRDDRIAKTGYECNGCPSSIAVGSALTQLLTGRETNKALLLEPDDLIRFLGGLPQGKEYYADLAVEALNKAISNSVKPNES